MVENDRDYLESLGRAIVAKRKALGLSQADLAYRVGMEVSNLSVIENGKSNPQMLTLVSISSALDCDLSALLPAIDDRRAFLEQRGKYRPLRRKDKR
jgi:transcriptional regulator with XRE-family HTH domain